MSENSASIELVNEPIDGRPQYRIGDAVLMRRHQHGRNALGIVLRNPEYFRCSILYDYAKKIDKENPDPQWRILKEVVTTYATEKKYDLPDNNELVIHLRLGNVKDYKGAPELLVEYTMDLVGGINVDVHAITVVTAVHFGETFYKGKSSRQEVSESVRHYADKTGRILELLATQGFAARLYSHREIDRDFSYLAHSKYLVLGNGLFSLCAAMISEAQCFVPPWAKTGTKLEFREMIDVVD